MLLVRDVEHVTDQFEVCFRLTERRRKLQRDFIHIHVVSDIEDVKMRGRNLHELRSVNRFGIDQIRQELKRAIQKQPDRHVRIDAALMLHEDDGLIFP